MATSLPSCGILPLSTVAAPCRVIGEISPAGPAGAMLAPLAVVERAGSVELIERHGDWSDVIGEAVTHAEARELAELVLARTAGVPVLLRKLALAYVALALDRERSTVGNVGVQ